MNKKNMFFVVLCATSAMQTALPAEPQEQSQKGWNQLCKSYATSLISGSAIGVITGKLSVAALYALVKNTENHIKNSPTLAVISIMTFGSILIAEYNLRSRLTDGINQSFEENEIQHKKNLIRDTAWIASWIAFLV